MRVTISGMPGSGKTTVAKILAAKLKLKHYYMGAIRRDIAKQKGITINELNRLSETDPSSDKLVDDYLVKLGKTEDNFVAEGRTAAHFIPDSMKLFMAVDVNVGAERIIKDAKERGKAALRNEQLAGSVKEEAALVQERIESDKRRYKKYYNIDIFDPDLYDLWLDTTDITAEQAADKILKFIKDKK